MSHSLITEIIVLALFIISISVVVFHYSKKSVIPFPTWILGIGVIFGLLQGYLPRELQIHTLDPHVILSVFLPIYTFNAARKLHWHELRDDLGPILYLSIVGVILSALFIGTLAWLLLPVSWLTGMLFGAIIAGTDPVAVGGLLGRFGLPEKLHTMIEGEALFNDATSIVLFTILSGLLFGTNEVTTLEALGVLSWKVLGAVPIGCVIGWGAKLLYTRWRETEIVQALFSLLVAYGSFFLGEEIFHASGIITTLVAGMVFVFCQKETCSRLGPSSFVNTFWEMLEILANSTLFLLLGVILTNHSFPWSLPLLGVAAGVLISRFLLIYGSSPIIAGMCSKFESRWKSILSWSGLRGAVSVALVFLLPQSFEWKSLFLCLVFFLVLWSMIVNPLALSRNLTKHPL